MTPQEINLAIAKACGWKRSPVGSWEKPDSCTVFFESSTTWRVEYAPPDYYRDLNAIHEAEEVLLEAGRKGDWRSWDKYRTALEERAGSECACHTPATQRAETFLKTLNLWCQ